MTLLVKYLQDPLVLHPTQVAQTSDPLVLHPTQVAQTSDPLVLHPTQVAQTSDPPFTVDQSSPQFTLGTPNPAKQKPNGSRFVFTSAMFILTCRYTVKYNEEKINTATKTNTLYIPRLLIICYARLFIMFLAPNFLHTVRQTRTLPCISAFLGP